MSRVKYKSGDVAHIYIRSYAGRVLFYSHIDYLHIFLIVCVEAKKYNVTVMGFCPMVDHLHLIVMADSRKAVSDFMRDVTAIFAKQHNAVTGENGSVFRVHYGLAVKIGGKKIRSCINYVYNNPVEKRLCNAAEEWKWNFLAYMASDHPFSEPLKLRNARYVVRRAAHFVKNASMKNSRISYVMLRRLFSRLTHDESLQLTDYIISCYNVISYQSLLKYYESYETMLIAMESNTGSEHDIREEFNSYSDAAYFRMAGYLAEHGIVGVEQILRLPLDMKKQLSDYFVRNRMAVPFQVRKFFHI